MKLKYFYGEQLRRTLKHLVRMFGEFKVQDGFDDNGVEIYKTVPCRYLNMNKQTQYIINGGSENVLPTAPLMTLTIKSFKMKREDIRSTMSIDTILGTNANPEENVYIHELDKQFQVSRMNPVQWELIFDLNIWTTTLTSKLELIEQIASIFNPACDLQMSTNPLDWTSLSVVELIDTVFSSTPIPLGQASNDYDIATLTFKCPVWLSLPAIEKQPDLIQQIVTNMQCARDELQINLDGYNDITTDVYTPKNLCVGIERVFENKNTERYTVTLLNQDKNPTTVNGQIYDWREYFNYLDPNYESKQLYLKFLEKIEDSQPINANILSIGSNQSANQLLIEIDTSFYIVKYGIKEFIIDADPIRTATDGDIFISLAENYIDYNGVTIKPNQIFSVNADKSIKFLELPVGKEYVYNTSDKSYYHYNETMGWIQVVLKFYRQGYWRIAFKDK